MDLPRQEHSESKMMDEVCRQQSHEDKDRPTSAAAIFSNRKAWGTQEWPRVGQGAG